MMNLINRFYVHMNSFLTIKGQKVFNDAVEDSCLLVGVVIVEVVLFMWASVYHFYGSVVATVIIATLVMIELLVYKFKPSPFFYGVGSMFIMLISILLRAEPVVIGFTLIVFWGMFSMSRNILAGWITIVIPRIVFLGLTLILFLGEFLTQDLISQLVVG